MRSARSYAGAVVVAFEEFLDAFVDEPEAGFHRDDGFADDREPEVSGFDESGVDWTDGDFVDAGAFDGDERERFAGLVDGGGRAGVVAERVPAVGPVLVVHEPAGLWVAGGDDAEQVGELAFEAARGEREGREAGDPGRRVVDAGDELDAGVGTGLGEEIDDADLVVVVVTGDEREPVAAVGERAELRGELVGGNVESTAASWSSGDDPGGGVEEVLERTEGDAKQTECDERTDQRHHERGPRRCECWSWTWPLLRVGGSSGWTEQDALALVQEGGGGGGQDREDRCG